MNSGLAYSFFLRKTNGLRPLQAEGNSRSGRCSFRKKILLLATAGRFGPIGRRQCRMSDRIPLVAGRDMMEPEVQSSRPQSA